MNLYELISKAIRRAKRSRTDETKRCALPHIELPYKAQMIKSIWYLPRDRKNIDQGKKLSILEGDCVLQLDIAQGGIEGHCGIRVAEKLIIHINWILKLDS
jgi:hypothetical protein